MTDIQTFIRESKSEEHLKEAAEHLKQYGITEDTLIRADIGFYDPLSDDEGQILDRILQDMDFKDTSILTDSSLVLGAGSELMLYLIDRSELIKITKGCPPVFNDKALSSNRPVFICRNPIDALCIMQMGHEAVLIATYDYRIFNEYLKKNPVRSSLILTSDCWSSDEEDNANVIQELHKAAKQIDFNPVIFELHKEGLEYRSIGDYYSSKDRADCINAVNGILSVCNSKEEENRQSYLTKATSSRIEYLFNQVYNAEVSKAISTGFKGLDEALNGGLYQGLYIMGAVSSLGKTSFCMQIADQIAAKGTDVLFFSLEQSSNEMMAKSISRIMYIAGNNLQDCRSSRDILNRSYLWDEQKKTAFLDAVKVYKDQTKSRIFIFEDPSDIPIPAGEEQKIRISLDDIRNTIQYHIQITGHRPIVFIDYLQILDPSNPKATDKQNMDEAVSTLRRMSKAFDIPVFVISSLNRESYNNPISLASFKESGSIEYSADVLIGLQPADITADEKKNKAAYDNIKSRQIKNLELKILKNRNGALSSTFFKFDGLHNFFIEATKEEMNPKNEAGIR